MAIVRRVQYTQEKVPPGVPVEVIGRMMVTTRGVIRLEPGQNLTLEQAQAMGLADKPEPSEVSDAVQG
jgi:hypothetical protein